MNSGNEKLMLSLKWVKKRVEIARELFLSFKSQKVQNMVIYGIINDFNLRPYLHIDRILRQGTILKLVSSIKNFQYLISQHTSNSRRSENILYAK